MKQCSKCNQIKQFEDFGKDSRLKSGLKSYCKKCNVIQTRKYQIKNREKELQRCKTWRENNREKSRSEAKIWKINNPEKAKDTYKKWAKNNRHLRSEAQNKRRLSIQNNKYVIRESFLRKLYLSPCSYCGSKSNIQMDHIVPISKGGRHSEGNLQPLCSSCNSSKKNNFWFVWKNSKKTIDLAKRVLEGESYAKG